MGFADDTDADADVAFLVVEKHEQTLVNKGENKLQQASRGNWWEGWLHQKQIEAQVITMKNKK